MPSAPNPMKLVVLAANGLAEMSDEDLRTNKLNLELEVSVWLRRSGAELAAAPRALLALRRALLEVSALDAPSEPTPLPVSDNQVAVSNLCVYLHGLIGRGADSMELERAEFVASALAHLGSAVSATRRSS